MSATAAAFTAVLIGLLTLLPGVAHAENEVVTSEPADGTTLATSPTQIVINFTEEIGELRIVSLECNTDPITLPAPTLSGNSRVMTVAIPDALPRGLCVATWRVSDSDGEPNGSSLLSFTVDAEPAATTTPADEDANTSSNGSTSASAPATTSGGDAETKTVALNRVETGTGPLWLGRVLSTL
ncbi:MAG: methionine-rich copper-binding protein CopC, partial [Ilumatobacter sp.]